MNTKILFMGTDQHSGFILRYLLENNYNIVGCVSQPDKVQGRKKELTPTVVKTIANEYNINVYQPANIKTDYQELLDIDYDVMLTVAYGQIIPEELLNNTKGLNVNVHYSLLPLYRGASPVQSAISNGDKTTGISIMEMVKKMDAGDVFIQEQMEIEKNDTTTTLFEKLNTKACKLLDQFFIDFENDKIKRTKQEEDKVTYTKMITKEDEHINFSINVDEVYNKIRSLLDYPGCYFMINDNRYKIIECHKDYNSSIIGSISNVDKSGIYLGCEGGNIVVTKLQPAGKKPMDIKSYLNGKSELSIGDMLD